MGAEEDEIERRSRVMVEAQRFSPWGRRDDAGEELELVEDRAGELGGDSVDAGEV